MFAGEYAVQSLPTLEVELDGDRHVAVNDAVVVSGTPGRIIELAYSIGGEELGTQPCDGLLCATPPGSTAYNLSNGGPVLVWGLDAAVITFVAPHTLHARPLVVGPDFELEVVNRTPDVEAVVLVDGHPVGVAAAATHEVTVRFGASRTLLATLPEQTFFGRYAQVFGSSRRARNSAQSDAAAGRGREKLHERWHRHGAARARRIDLEGGGCVPTRWVGALAPPSGPAPANGAGDRTDRCGRAAVVRWRGAPAAPHREPRPDPGGRARARRRG